jgi:hypothetical protein
LLGGFGRRFEEQIVQQTLVGASDFVEACRQSEGQQKIGDMQEQDLLLLQPDLRILILALGTVAVATGVVAVLQFLTMRTAIDLSTQGWRTTLLHRPHGLEVSARHAAGVLLAVGRTILAKDIRQF